MSSIYRMKYLDKVTQASINSTDSSLLEYDFDHFYFFYGLVFAECLDCSSFELVSYFLLLLKHPSKSTSVTYYLYFSIILTSVINQSIFIPSLDFIFLSLSFTLCLLLNFEKFPNFYSYSSLFFSNSFFFSYFCFFFYCRILCRRTRY